MCCVGGLHFVSQDGSEDCTESNAQCTFVALRGTEFVDNQASSAGGAILSSDLNAIRIACAFDQSEDPLTYLTQEEFEALDILNSLENVCQDWRGNAASLYGESLASYARQIRKVIRYEETEVDEEVDGNQYIVQNHRSGSQIPSLFLEVVDELDQGPATGAGNQTIEATMWSPDRLFSGAVGVRLEDGFGNFSGIAGYREAGYYRVRVDFSEDSIPSFTLLVEIRGCSIGEAAAANGTVCQPCNGDTYNFYPDRPEPGCIPCPDDARCDSVVIRPEDGFWHSSPCSPHIQECLTRGACDASDREEMLRALGLMVEDCNLSSEFINSYTSAECKEVVHFPLCPIWNFLPGLCGCAVWIL